LVGGCCWRLSTSHSERTSIFGCAEPHDL
jgi:hypothetical protein